MRRSTRSIKVAGIRNSPIVQKVSTGQTRMMSQTKVISSIRISPSPSSIMYSMLLFFIRKHNSNIRNCYYIVCFSPLFFPPCSARLHSTIFHAHYCQQIHRRKIAQQPMKFNFTRRQSNYQFCYSACSSSTDIQIDSQSQPLKQHYTMHDSSCSEMRISSTDELKCICIAGIYKYI